MKGAPRSERFNDVYFSATDGLAETAHVFLRGNNLPSAWKGRKSFTIAETGFGTGLNVLAAWKLFADTAAPDQTLHLLSVEKYPLDAGVIQEMLCMPLGAGYGGYAPYVEKLCERYPAAQTGTHIIDLDPRLRLTLIFDDVNAALPEMDTPVDCWFLDGFKPSANPEMWTETVFSHMSRLTGSGGTFATFTAAGFVRRGLTAAGFTVSKVPGYGTKREMLTGVKP